MCFIWATGVSPGASECDGTAARCLTCSRGSDWAAQRRGQSGQQWVTRRQDSGSAALLSSVVWSHPDRNTLCTTSCCVNLCSIPYTAPEEIVPHGTDTRHDTLEGGLVCVAKSNLDRMKGGQIFFFSFNFLFFRNVFKQGTVYKWTKGLQRLCFKRIFCSFCKTHKNHILVGDNQRHCRGLCLGPYVLERTHAMLTWFCFLTHMLLPPQKSHHTQDEVPLYAADLFS